MKYRVVPNYNDFFEENEPDIKTLLEEIPTVNLLMIISLINAEITLTENDFLSQKRIIQLFLARQTKSVKSEFQLKLNSFIHKIGEFPSLFSIHYTNQLLHYVLCNFKEGEIRNLTIEQDFNVFKAYMVFVSIQLRKERSYFEKTVGDSKDFFFKNSWPLLNSQYESNLKITPISEITRSYIFFDYLGSETKFKGYLEAFLAQRGFDHFHSYIVSLIQLIQHSGNKNNSVFYPNHSAYLKTAKGFESLLDLISLDIVEYKKLYHSGSKSYTGIKERPVFSLKDGSYLILNWNYLLAKFYESLIYDFYNYSGIRELDDFKIFPDFKKIISKEVTENLIFRKLIKNIFSKKHSILQFSDSIKSFPDAYYRSGNKVFLIELKDISFPSIDEGSFENIKSVLDKKLNNKSKGTGQIIKQINILKSSGFEENPNYKYKNLIIYPIIVFTDEMFKMPGVNEYLKVAFEKKLSEQKLNENFKQVKPLVLINLQYLLSNLDTLSDEKVDFINIIESYYLELKRISKKVNRKPDIENFFESFHPFDLLMDRKNNKGEVNKEDSSLRAVFKIFNITFEKHTN